MSPQLKYVIIDGMPVLFGSGIEHSRMKRLGDVDSAGFVCLTGNGRGNVDAQVYGESLSLGIKPGDRDERIIEMYVNGVTL